jgi:hypothetical protein
MAVRLTDGRILEHRTTAATGTPENPGTREDLEGKFQRLAGVVLPAENVARLTTLLRALPDLPDVAKLAELAAG